MPYRAFRVDFFFVAFLAAFFLAIEVQIYFLKLA